MSPRCDSVCTRAEKLSAKIDASCGGQPESATYDNPDCYPMEKKFYGMRAEIFECWCTKVIRFDREAQ
ncbi:MAG: hypothetical protein KC492_17460 [Myxococcales bacterium]|nr:hypothetical protein [Myxococcales bacterium]